MTNEEAFIIAANHLLKQNAKSISLDDTCMYRGPNGLMCGIGPLIPDNLYHQNMEGNTPRGVRDMNPEVFKGLDTAMLARVQNIHDDREIDQWPDMLKTMAEEHGYKWP